MADAPRCPVSGQPMRRDVRPFTIAYKGRSRTFDMPGWYSDAAAESIFTRADLRVSDRHLATLKAEVENLAGPDEIARLRRRFRLSQVEAGRILGGGPRAFQKYESGEVVASRGMTNLLRLLARHPEDVALIAAETEGTPDLPR